MLKTFEDTSAHTFFRISSLEHIPEHERGLTFKIVWSQAGDLSLQVDNEPFELGRDQILCLAPTQHLEVLRAGKGAVFQYNREFYCIVDHDQEVSCAGLLYYGSNETPLITLDEKQQRKMNLLFQVFKDEFDTHDNIQEEMLRMLLKRLIILCTRWFKDQWEVEYKDDELDLIRQFRILVEMHFREKQTVSEYADLLYKSPKTLSNLFAKNGEKSPLRQIHERMALEAKRLLLYTDKPVQEIAWELNFEENAHFSRFFKRLSGQSPSAFRRSMKALKY